MRLLGINGVLRRKSTRTTVANPYNLRFADHRKRAWGSVTHPGQWSVADLLMQLPAAGVATSRSSQTCIRAGYWGLRYLRQSNHFSLWTHCGKRSMLVVATTRILVPWASSMTRMPVPNTPAVTCTASDTPEAQNGLNII